MGSSRSHTLQNATTPPEVAFGRVINASRQLVCFDVHTIGRAVHAVGRAVFRVNPNEDAIGSGDYTMTQRFEVGQLAIE